jgi:hypothetical protein
MASSAWSRPRCPHVRMDLGGELGSCPEVVELFEKSGYKVELTAAQSSNQNGPGD